MAGPYYGAQWENDRSQPVNILQMFTSIVGRNLIAKNPKCSLSTFNQSAKPTVHAMQDWFNRQTRKIRLDTALKRWVMNAFCSMGVLKVALATPSDAANSQWRLKAGDPFVANVDNDDFVFDHHARDIEEASFYGHRTRVPTETLKATYGKKAKDIGPSEDKLYNLEGDERISVIGRGMWGDTIEYEDMTDVWEFYLPRHRVVVTVLDNYLTGATDESGNASPDYRARALSVKKWIGPDSGPYHFLNFLTVPGNALGKGPLQDVWDLHQSINNIYRKLIRTAHDYKSVTTYSRAADGDAQRLKDVMHGGIVPVDHPESIVPMEMNRISNELFLLGETLIQRASWCSGNLETMGGLSPQGKTARQEQILNQNSAGGVADMFGSVVEGTSEVCEALLWFYHHHPTKEMKIDFALNGLPNHGIVRTIRPEQRHALSWEDLDLKVDPYSLTHKTPEQRMQNLVSVVKGVLLPMLPMAAQQGVAFDMKHFLSLLAEFSDEPNLQDILSFQQPVTEGSQPSAPGIHGEKEPSEQIRHSVSERTEQGDMKNLRSTLLGVNQGGKPETNGVLT